VLFVPFGLNFRIARWFVAAVTAPSETNRFPLSSKHKPSEYLSPAAKVDFVPSSVYLKIECPSATKRFPPGSKANPPACAAVKPKTIPKLATCSAANARLVPLFEPRLIKGRTAEVPASVMNSRRLMGLAIRLRTKAYHINRSMAALCITANGRPDFRCKS
jgi:hypothetical protein